MFAVTPVVAPGVTRVVVRKERAKMLVKERVMEKACYPIKTH
jgi:hypothetical protein